MKGLKPLWMHRIAMKEVYVLKFEDNPLDAGSPFMFWVSPHLHQRGELVWVFTATHAPYHILQIRGSCACSLRAPPNNLCNKKSLHKARGRRRIQCPPLPPAVFPGFSVICGFCSLAAQLLASSPNIERLSCLGREINGETTC